MQILTLTVIVLCLARLLVCDKRTIADKVQAAGRSIDSITGLARNMASDIYTKASLSQGGRAVQSKIRGVQAKWNAAKTAYNNEPGDTAENIGDAISGVGEGLVGFVSGIKNGDWVEGVQGALTIISSVVALAGPAGVIASSILSLVSSIFGLFGGSTKTESMDEKMERIVSEEIDKGREKDLKADVEGLKVAYRSLSASIQEFRESKELEEEQANELYNQAFLELSVFGKVQARINDICNKISDYHEAVKCLETNRMYADIAIIRQILLTDMASLMADVHDRKVGVETGQLLDVRRVRTRGQRRQAASGLLVVSNNLLHLIKQEQEKDREFLSYLGDPFNHPKRRYIIDIYFSNPEKFPSLKAYLRTLHKNVPGGLFKDYAMLCSDERLEGNCNIFKVGNYSKFSNELHDKVQSMYLPLGLQATGFQYSEFGGISYGPFAGPIALSIVPGKDTWTSLRVSTTGRDAEKEVRFCGREKLYPGYCDTAPAGIYNLANYNGLKWDDKFASMYIPKGLAVDGYTGASQGGSHYEQFIGPHTVNLVYNENNWKSIWIRSSDGLDALDQVWFCDEEDLEGHCKTTWKSLYYLPGSYNMNWSGKIMSLKIPGGYHVTGYSNTSHRGDSFGPYSGPAVISKVDSSDKWNSMKLTEFTRYIADDQEVPSKEEQKKKDTAEKEKNVERKEKENVIL